MRALKALMKGDIATYDTSSEVIPDHWVWSDHQRRGTGGGGRSEEEGFKIAVGAMGGSSPENEGEEELALLFTECLSLPPSGVQT